MEVIDIYSSFGSHNASVLPQAAFRLVDWSGMLRISISEYEGAATSIHTA